jgi:hypothetical protein
MSRVEDFGSNVIRSYAAGMADGSRYPASDFDVITNKYEPV